MSALLLAASSVRAPSIAYEPMMPFLVLAGGMVATIAVSLVGRSFFQRVVTPLTAVGTLIAAGVLFALRVSDAPDESLISGALTLDDLALSFDLLFVATALLTSAIAWRSETLRAAGRGEFHSLLLSSVLGMTLLASATNLVSLFIAFELLSIPLYVLCAADLRRDRSLESGLKYLIIGSLGSAILLYGLAFLYGATGATDFNAIAEALSKSSVAGDPLLLVGVALTLAGLSFKASVAPFHQWTPDVYEGAPTPVTAFMAVATKAAVLVLLLRLSAEALAPVRDNWAVVLAVLAALTIIVGNLGALGQESLKRMLGYSGVAQVGYLLTGVVVGTGLGTAAVLFYLVVYLFMNIGPFAVIAARERAGAGDGLGGIADLGREQPVLAWSMTICMISLAGLPVTAGFVGKLLLVQAAVFGHYEWLGVMIVIGSAISLGYYLRVIAAIWMPGAGGAKSAPQDGLARVAGASPRADSRRHPELVAVAVLAAIATVVLGVFPDPLLDLAREAGERFILIGG